MLLTQPLVDHFSPRSRERGARLFRNNAVSALRGERDKVEANVRGSQLYWVQLIRDNVELGVHCSCPRFASTGECKHVWAALLAAEAQGRLQGIREKPFERVYVLDDAPEEDFLLDPKEMILDPEPYNGRGLPLRDLPSPASVLPDWYRTIESLSVFGPPRKSREWPAGREIYYLLMGSIKVDDRVSIRVVVRDRLRKGGWGQLKSESFFIDALDSVTDVRDREILFSLAGSEQPYSFAKIDFRTQVELYGGQAELLLPKMCNTGRFIFQRSISEEPDIDVPLRWDEGPPWQFRMTPVREGRYWRFSGYFQRNEERLSLEDLRFVSATGFLSTVSIISRVDAISGLRWLNTVWPKSKLLLPDRDVDKFLERFSEMRFIPRVDWPAEFSITEIRNAPEPSLMLRYLEESPQRGSSYEGILQFAYGELIAPPSESGVQCHYGPDRQLIWRDNDFEAAAAAKLTELGARPIDRRSLVPVSWEVTSDSVSALISALQEAGWRVLLEGRPVRQATAIQAELSTSIDWFDLHGNIIFGDEKLSLPDLLKALARNETVLQLPDGSAGLVPDTLIENYKLLASFGVKGSDTIRFEKSQGRLLDVLLDRLPEVQPDAAFKEYRTRIESWENIEPVAQPVGFHGALRDYQREGLAWMQFLSVAGLGGCLADDMGVGKTAQVLALLEKRREIREADPDSPAGPSLVVAPRSVIFNWKQEAARFTPALKILDHTQADRHENLSRFDQFDLVLITYGTLRRDIGQLRKIRFDYAVLDEAQAIKNAGSDSAKAARALRAEHKLALSGTPVENHLGELRSLFDFLNPGMLGPSATGLLSARRLRNADEEARTILARALRPFLLRRTKEQVARELPAKTEQTLYCEMKPEQQQLYEDLRDHYRRSLLGKISASEWSGARMQVLEALLRLRQAACHPGLIDKQRLDENSAKLETLMANISEVIEGGHKLLVFSQFTSFLAIVRRQLDREPIRYAYLDGRTKDREGAVNQFQTDPDCSVFLVSLKAGGVGLNLTAAEYVFLLDPWWNPAVEAQAIDRAHRIGQTNHVFAYRMITRDTVEEKVVQLQEYKRGLSASILTEENKNLNALTRDDINFLLSSQDLHEHSSSSKQ